MKGYGNEEENSKAFLDGWLRTGDLVYYDERGYIFVKDRLKEVIKVSIIAQSCILLVNEHKKREKEFCKSHI